MNRIEFFKILFNTHYEKVYRTTYLIIQNESIARDATQEAFIIAYKQLDNLKDLDNMHSWLTVVASNQAKNTIKKHANCIPIADINELENKLVYSANIIEQKDKEIDLTKALNMIKVKYREVLVFKYYLDLTDQEIADMFVYYGRIRPRIRQNKATIPVK